MANQIYVVIPEHTGLVGMGIKAFSNHSQAKEYYLEQVKELGLELDDDGYAEINESNGNHVQLHIVPLVVQNSIDLITE